MCFHNLLPIHLRDGRLRSSNYIIIIKLFDNSILSSPISWGKFRPSLSNDKLDLVNVQNLPFYPVWHFITDYWQMEMVGCKNVNFYHFLYLLSAFFRHLVRVNIFAPQAYQFEYHMSYWLSITHYWQNGRSEWSSDRDGRSQK